MSSTSQSKPRKLGSEAVLELFVSKWAIRVVHALLRGTKRHGALRRELNGVSQKMLTQTLRGLERAGLIQRTAHNLVPPKVEYSLTRLGQSFVEPLNALCTWAEAHREELEFAASLKKTAKHPPAADEKSRQPQGIGSRRALV
jgi:DNA-binding HxlR family transcriptional regulator